MNAGVSVPTEIRTLTGVRAYAAIWVMLLHLPFSVGVLPHVTLGPIARHGAWGVDLFFVLSGFILSLLYVPRFQAQGLRKVYRNYLVARFARIYPLHLVTLVILAVYFISRRVFTDEPPMGAFGLRSLVANATLLHGWGYVDRLTWNYPSWSISAEWFAYLLMTPALACGLRRLSTLGSILVAFSLWTALYMVVHDQDQRIHELTISWAIPRIVAEFTLGYALYRMYERITLMPNAADFLVAIGIGGLLTLCFLPDSAEWFLAPVLAVLILGLAKEGPFARALFGNRLAVFWGERSYAIYMVHAVVQIFNAMILIHLEWENLTATQGWALFFALIAVVLVASHLAYEWIEVPWRVRLRKTWEQRTASLTTRPAIASV